MFQRCRAVGTPLCSNWRRTDTEIEVLIVTARGTDEHAGTRFEGRLAVTSELPIKQHDAGRVAGTVEHGFGSL